MIKNIYDLCKVERAVKGKLYPKGTCYVKLSAVDEFVGQLKKEGEIESRYAALVPKEGTREKLLLIALKMDFPEFIYSHRTTINLQFKELQYLRIRWEEDEKKVARIEWAGDVLERIQEAEERMLKKLTEVKRWYLSKMFI